MRRGKENLLFYEVIDVICHIENITAKIKIDDIYKKRLIFFDTPLERCNVNVCKSLFKEIIERILVDLLEVINSNYVVSIRLKINDTKNILTIIFDYPKIKNTYTYEPNNHNRISELARLQDLKIVKILEKNRIIIKFDVNIA